MRELTPELAVLTEDFERHLIYSDVQLCEQGLRSINYDMDRGEI